MAGMVANACGGHGHLKSVISLGKELLHLNKQFRKRDLDDSPNDLVFNRVLAVGEDIPEGNDLTIATDGLNGLGIEFMAAVEGLTDDFKASFHREGCLLISAIRFEIHAGGEIQDQFTLLRNRFNIFPQFRLHRP